MAFKIYDEFERCDCKPNVRLSKIQTHQKDGKGKNVKLSNPIFYFEYIGLDKSEARMYEADLEKLVYFERWKKV